MIKLLGGDQKPIYQLSLPSAILQRDPKSGQSCFKQFFKEMILQGRFLNSELNLTGEGLSKCIMCTGTIYRALMLSKE